MPSGTLIRISELLEREGEITDRFPHGLVGSQGPMSGGCCSLEILKLRFCPAMLTRDATAGLLRLNVMTLV